MMTSATATAPAGLLRRSSTSTRMADRAHDVCDGLFRIAGVTLTVGGAATGRTSPSTPIANAGSRGASSTSASISRMPSPRRDDQRSCADLGTRSCVRGIAQLPPDFGPTDALARRLQNWIYAGNALRRGAGVRRLRRGFDDAARRRHPAARRLPAGAPHAGAQSPHLELYALFIVALALPSIGRRGARLQFAWRALQENMRSRFPARWRAPGALDALPHDRAALVPRRARERTALAGFAIPHGYDDRLRRALAFGARLSSARRLDAGAVGQRHRPLRGPAGAIRAPCSINPVRRRSAAFIDAGYYVQAVRQTTQRTAAEPSAPDLRLRPVGDGGHGHYDALSIDVWCGRHLIVDPGRYTYDGVEPSGGTGSREPRRTTRCASTASIRRCIARASRSSVCRCASSIARRRRSSTSSAARSSARIRRGSPAPRALRRQRLLARRRRARSADPHDYDLRYHLAADALGAISVSAEAVSAPGLRLLLDGPGAIVIDRVDRGGLRRQGRCADRVEASGRL